MPANKQQSTPLKGYRLFRIFGFDVKLNSTWLLLALLITWTLAAGIFPAEYPELTQHTYWWMGIAGALGIMFSIVFHELSHSLVARYFGLQIKGITLFIFGGVAEMEEEPANPKTEFLMAAAGPISSLLLGFFFFQLEQLAQSQQWPIPLVGVSHYLGLLNIVLAVFNLIPAFPLDGGRMLRAALWHWQQNLQTATRTASGIGSAFGVAMMIVGALAILQGNFIGGMWWILIGAFLRGAAKATFSQMIVKNILGDKPVSHFMRSDPVTVPPSVTIDEFLKEYVYHYHYKMFPVMDHSNLIGCITTRDIKDLPLEQRAFKTVGDFVNRCSPENSVSPDTKTTALITAMAKPNASTRYMVVENNRLLGVISLRDLTEYIALKLELGR